MNLPPAVDNPAHILWVELSTRITTENLHYRSGNEEAAAASVHKLFGITRELMEKAPGEKDFNELALRLLNDVLRPYTARWHGWMIADDARCDKDGKAELKFADEWVRRQFRKELLDLQPLMVQMREGFAVLKDGGTLKEADAAIEKMAAMQAALALFQAGETLTTEQDQLLPQAWRKPKNAALGKDLTPGIQGQVRFTGVKDQKAQDDLVKDINSAEGGYVKQRRGVAKNASFENATGLAFSGGGIRSATYCLGITQVLMRRGLLPQFDYMSTVSGGGYFGSFLSSVLGTGEFETPPANPKDITNDEQVAEAGKRLKAVFDPDQQQREAPATRHLRNRSRYLLGGGFLTKFSGVSMVLAGVLFNVLILLPFVLIAALLTKAVHDSHWLGDYEWIKNTHHWLPRSEAPGSEWLLKAAVVTAGLVLLYPLVKGLTMWGFRKRQASGFLCVLKWWEYVFFIASAATALLLVTWLLPLGFRTYASIREFQLPEWLGLAKDHVEHWLAAAGLSTMAVLHFLAARAAKAGGGGSRWFMKLAVFIVPTLFFIAYLGVGYRLMFARGAESWPCNIVGWVTGCLLFWGWVLVNVNTYSPHGYYRDRLSECYLLVRKRLTKAKDAKLELVPNDRVRLSELGACIAAPYHLINAAMNVPSSADPELRGRNADFFLFSRFFCGSPMVGYHATTKLEEDDAHLDLGTALAISGAAASSNMGWLTNNTFRMLLTLVNVRLGYWLKNPGAKSRGWLTGPGPLCLLREMFASQMDEGRNYLNLSDGGHIENLAVYELLRRRCKFIVCVDGGQEADMQCVDLIRLERYAALDLGIKMHYDLTDLKLQPSGYSRAFGVLVKIDYDPPSNEAERDVRKSSEASWGWMLYLKLAMVGYGPGYVMDYKRLNPDFPHQSTANQIYDEAQFEAYRALGEFAAESLLRPEIVGSETPKSVGDWFQKLANSLLPDNDEAWNQ